MKQSQVQIRFYRKCKKYRTYKKSDLFYWNFNESISIRARAAPMGALNQILLSISNLSSIEFCLMSESLIETLALACKNFIEVNFLFELLRAFFGNKGEMASCFFQFSNSTKHLLENSGNWHVHLGKWKNHSSTRSFHFFWWFIDWLSVFTLSFIRSSHSFTCLLNHSTFRRIKFMSSYSMQVNSIQVNSIQVY